MTDRGDAEAFEIVLRQIGQKLGVDVVLPKRRLVLLKSQVPKEITDIHPCTPTEDRADRMGLDASVCPVDGWRCVMLPGVLRRSLRRKLTQPLPSGDGL